MTDLIVVPQATQWQKLKALVLDSVSSPITRRVYNLGLDEFIAWYALEPRPGFQGNRERLARGPGGPRAWRCFDQRPHHRGVDAQLRGLDCLARLAAPKTRAVVPRGERLEFRPPFHVAADEVENLPVFKKRRRAF